MKVTILNSVKLMLLLVLFILVIGIMESVAWWGFVIPAIILGGITSFLGWEVPCFKIGFLSGFIAWFGANIYYDKIYHSTIMSKMGMLLDVNKMVIFIFSGVICGIISGLALYTGKNIKFIPGPVSTNSKNH